MNVQIIWDLPDDPRGNVAHIDDNGFTIDDVVHVIEHASASKVSRSTGRPCVFGFTLDGTHVIVIYDEIDEDTIYPVTCYAVPEPTKPRRSRRR